jgi:purine catabolism regulator
MPPSLAAVAALPQLGLVALSEAPLDRPVRWVAVSELADPTPFLEGDELVLTTGMRLTDERYHQEYVRLLVQRGVAGLGFAVGLGHETVPRSLVDAAAGQGLPLFEVPRPTPFIAIGKAVWRMLAAERYEDVTRAFQAQRELTKAALRGEEPLVVRLARELGGWALLLDSAGDVRHASSAAARERAGELRTEVERLRKGRGAASVALVGASGHVVLQTLGLGGRPRGFLAVGTAEPLPPVAHTIVGAALSLLTLSSEGPRARRELRAAVAGLLVGTPPAHGLPEPPVRIMACAGADEVVEALEADPAGERCLVLPRPGSSVVIAPDRLADHVIEIAAGSGAVGVSDPLDLDDAEQGLVQAEQALAAARRHQGERPVLRYGDLPGQGLLGLLDRQAAEGFAETLLAPLVAQDPALLDTLRAYLQVNGQGEAAARDLGVHRHTLRHRMRRAAEILGRDPDDPAVRAELWIALAVHDRSGRS